MYSGTSHCTEHLPHHPSSMFILASSRCHCKIIKVALVNFLINLYLNNNYTLLRNAVVL